MKNKDLDDFLVDDLLKASLSTLPNEPRNDSITDKVMQQIATPPIAEATPRFSMSREAILVVGLLFGLGAGVPAFVDLTQWLPSVANWVGTEVEPVNFGAWFSTLLNASPAQFGMSLNVWLAGFAAMSMAALLLVPALED